MSSPSRCKRSQCALNPITASRSEPAAPVSAAARCRQTQCHYGDLTLLYSFISVLQVLFYDRHVTLTVQGGILRCPLSKLFHQPCQTSVRLHHAKISMKTLKEPGSNSDAFFRESSKRRAGVPRLRSSLFYLYPLWLPLDPGT